MATSLFTLFCHEVLPAHMCDVDRQADIARRAVLDAFAGRAPREYAKACRVAHDHVLQDARHVFRSAWPAWVADLRDRGSETVVPKRDA